MKTRFHSIELLETRIAPATLTVISNADGGPGTLRDAIVFANQTVGPDTIAFNLPAGSTTIQLLGELPGISLDVFIDGTTQPGYMDSPLVTLDGAATQFINGLNFILSSNFSQVAGLRITNFDLAGIRVAAPNILIAGCDLIGNQTGISVEAENVTIGGMGAAGRNVISGNLSHGIAGFSAAGLVVQNSYIGVDRAGLAGQGNGNDGIHIESSSSVTIGGAEKNAISGNGGDGINFINCTGNVRVHNSYIGVYPDWAFNAASANAGAGVRALGSANFLIGPDGMIGTANYIANNSGPGIAVTTRSDQGFFGTATIAGNFIGTVPGGLGTIVASNLGGIVANGPDIVIGGATGQNVIAWSTGKGISTRTTLFNYGVEVRANSFSDQGGDVIDVFGDGATANDPGDFDNVPNFPVLDGAFRDAMNNEFVKGSLEGSMMEQYRVDLYSFAPLNGTYTYLQSVDVVTDADGRASFLEQVALPGNATKVAATATRIVLFGTSELSPLAPIGPLLNFTDASILSQAEGNSGATLVSFTVALSFAPAGNVSVVLSPDESSTATQGTDYTFTPSQLNFNPTTTQQTVTVAITGDTTVEPREFINFALGSLMGDAILAGDVKTVEIRNDDTSLKISTDGKSATWRDVDGDLVTLKATKGILDVGDFQLDARGTLGGEVLQLLDLNDDGPAAKGVGLTFTAKFDKVNNLGDGSVHVGFLNATGVDLGVVTIPGDLAFTQAGDAVLTDGAVKLLSVGSLGVLGNTQTAGTGVGAFFNGKVNSLIVRGDVFNFTIVGDTTMAGNAAAGSFGAITIGGNLLGESGELASIFASGDIASVKIGGSIIGDATVANNGVRALGKIGAVTIAGSLRSTDPNSVSAIEAGTTLGKVTVGGDMHFSLILALGKAQPANSAAALAIAGVTVKGRVFSSGIAAGLSSNGSLNPDVQIGSIAVGGDWVRSNAFAGTERGPDFRIGTPDDVVFTPTTGFTDKPAIVSKIASVTVKGHIYGGTLGTQTYGFVAQNIGKFVRGGAAYSLRPNPTPNAQPLDFISLSIVGNVFLREVI